YGGGTGKAELGGPVRRAPPDAARVLRAARRPRRGRGHGAGDLSALAARAPVPGRGHRQSRGLPVHRGDEPGARTGRAPAPRAVAAGRTRTALDRAARRRGGRRRGRTPAAPATPAVAA